MDKHIHEYVLGREIDKHNYLSDDQMTVSQQMHRAVPVIHETEAFTVAYINVFRRPASNASGLSLTIKELPADPPFVHFMRHFWLPAILSVFGLIFAVTALGVYLGKKPEYQNLPQEEEHNSD